jgi:hypothetical protein
MESRELGSLVLACAQDLAFEVWALSSASADSVSGVPSMGAASASATAESATALSPFHSRLLRTIPVHTAEVNSMRVCGRRLVTASEDGTAAVLL